MHKSQVIKTDLTIELQHILNDCLLSGQHRTGRLFIQEHYSPIISKKLFTAANQVGRIVFRRASKVFGLATNRRNTAILGGFSALYVQLMNCV